MEYKSLKNVSSIIMGQSPKSNTYNENGEGIPFFQGKSDFGKLNPSIRMYCTEPKKVANEFDILMSVRAPVGDVNIANTECCIGRGLCAIRGNKEINNKYLYYCLITKKQEFNSRATGSTFKAINKSVIEELEIPIPSLEIQNKIVEILDKAQELINKRTEQIDYLDELIKSKFIEMFGNPVRNTKKITQEPLSKHIELIGGYAFKSGDFEEQGIPVLRIGNINSGYFKANNLKFWKDDKALEKYMLYPNDLVISLTGTVGKDDYANICKLGNDYPKYYLNQRNAKIILKDTVNTEYITELLRNEGIKRRLTSSGKGVRQANISNKNILDLVVPIPPREQQDKFADIIKSIDILKSDMTKSLEELENNYNSLLQRAFKGELFI